MTIVCPLCETPSPTIAAALTWQCARCGYKWDNIRLASGFAVYAETHPARATDRS